MRYVNFMNEISFKNEWQRALIHCVIIYAFGDNTIRGFEWKKNGNRRNANVIDYICYNITTPFNDIKLYFCISIYRSLFFMAIRSHSEFRRSFSSTRVQSSKKLLTALTEEKSQRRKKDKVKKAESSNEGKIYFD